MVHGRGCRMVTQGWGEGVSVRQAGKGWGAPKPAGASPLCAPTASQFSVKSLPLRLGSLSSPPPTGFRTSRNISPTRPPTLACLQGLPDKGKLRSLTQPSPSGLQSVLGDGSSSLQSLRPWPAAGIRVTLTTLEDAKVSSHACAGPACALVSGLSPKSPPPALLSPTLRRRGSQGSLPRSSGGPTLSQMSTSKPLRWGSLDIASHPTLYLTFLGIPSTRPGERGGKGGAEGWRRGSGYVC